jgi:nucleoside 2-deoxyribosyltransferase
MKFYIASRLENASNVRELADKLEALGYQHTYDWTVHGSVQDQGEARMEEVARNEARGIYESDVAIVLLPGGRGTHCEIGLALGFGKDVWIVGPRCDESGRECAFYYCPQVKRFESVSELMQHMAVGAL